MDPGLNFESLYHTHCPYEPRNVHNALQHQSLPTIHQQLRKRLRTSSEGTLYCVCFCLLLGSWAGGNDVNETISQTFVSAPHHSRRPTVHPKTIMPSTTTYPIFSGKPILFGNEKGRENRRKKKWTKTLFVFPNKDFLCGQCNLEAGLPPSPLTSLSH